MPMQEKSMRNNMMAVFRITVFHIILVLFSAFYMSKEAWFFISGGLYYIFFGAFFAFMLLKNRLMNRRYKNEEWFPVVNNEGKVTGKAPRSLCHDGKSFLLHPVVHLHIFNRSGKLYLQKRSMKKDTQPGKWDTSVGGHIGMGESVAEALIRETREELGLNGFTPQFLRKLCLGIIPRKGTCQFLFYCHREDHRSSTGMKLMKADSGHCRRSGIISGKGFSPRISNMNSKIS